MLVKVKKPTHIYVLGGEVEVTPAEAHRLMMLGAIEINKVQKEVKLEEKEVKEVKIKKAKVSK